jgi:hypothetical protein
LSRPIIDRLHSESRQGNGIIVRLNHQRLLQQNLPEAAVDPFTQSRHQSGWTAWEEHQCQAPWLFLNLWLTRIWLLG